MKQKNIFTAFLLFVVFVSCTSHKPSETQPSLLVLSPEQMVVDSLVQINNQQSETFSTNAIRTYDQIMVSPGFFPTENYSKLDNQLVFLVEQEDLYRIDAYKKTMSYEDWL